MESITYKYSNKTFEDIKRIDEYGNEFWYARELQKVLEYKEWKNFKVVIDKAIMSCKNREFNVFNHFVEVNKMIELGKIAKRKILDYKLSRYACYLIVQNADPSKEVIALGQTYFAIQTYKRLYNGDNMDEDELIANLFRINQTKQKLLRDKVQGENNAKNVHYEVGKKVRQAIADIGGRMPEEMPTPKKSLKELEREKKQEKRKIKEKCNFNSGLYCGSIGDWCNRLGHSLE